MAKTREKSGATKSASAARAVKSPPAPEKPDPVQRYQVKPEFWDSIFDSIPPWADEIVAIVLIVFGIVSLLSLLNLSS
ncbi:MAG: hypothetical protein CUN53_11955, partial [Phototrophicales bacterium]